MKILGLDLGTTSVGWGLVNWDEGRLAGTIVGTGVRIFPEGVIQDKSASFPPNQTRRAKRLLRRVLRRRRGRRRAIAKILQGMGMLPEFSKDPTSPWARVMRMDLKNVSVEESNDPYVLRKRALSQPLAPQQLGRVLYHLSKRRGFLGRDFEEDENSEKKKELKGLKEDISKLRDKIAGNTLGAYLANLPWGERKRSRHTHRDMYKTEFEQIWRVQSQHYKDVLTPEKKLEIESTLFSQRPVFWRLNTLGKCRFCPGEPLAAAGAWATQQFVMLEHINKLRIAGGNARPLDREERSKVAEIAQGQSTVSFGGIRKALKPLWKARGEDTSPKFNLEESLKGIKGNTVEAKLLDIFGEADWDRHPSKSRIRNELHQKIFQSQYRQLGNARIEIRRGREQNAERAEVAKWMVKHWEVTEKQAEALSKLSLPPAWNRLSARAISLMLPEMEKGTGVGDLTMSPEWAEWRQKNFPDMHRPTGEILDKLPSHPKEMPQLRNPTVLRTLNEVRKVVNNIINVYGKPDLIRLELARELRQPKARRQETDKKNRERESERKAAAEELVKNSLPEDRRNIEKWLLWKECKELCPYTGKKIGFDALFRQGLFDVEHIFPKHRSLDNSFANKTLCETEFNRTTKSGKTPWEVFGHDAEALDALKQRLISCFGDDNPKSRRFLAERFAEIGTEAFSTRQLSDTSYAAVAVRDFLRKLYPDDGRNIYVLTCSGPITSQLRYAWGLNSILSDNNTKNRGDHRHHAIDALAVACATVSFIKSLSEWNEGWRLGKKPDLKLPWRSFREDVQKAIASIIVSHRVRKKVNGALHAETYYGDTGEDTNEKSITYRNFITRKPVNMLTKNEIDNIRDPRVRDIVRVHVEKKGGDPKKAFPPYPRLNEGPEIRKVRLSVKRQPQLMVKTPAGFVDPAANHHMAIYKETDGQITYQVVSLFEARQRLVKGQAVVSKKSLNGGDLLMSLSPGDALEFPPPEQSTKPVYRMVLGVWSNGSIILADNFIGDGVVWGRPNANSILKMGGRKVSIDPIGRIKLARD